VELLALADVDRVDLVKEPGLFEEQRDLVPVGGGPVVEGQRRRSCSLGLA